LVKVFGFRLGAREINQLPNHQFAQLDAHNFDRVDILGRSVTQVTENAAHRT